MGTLIHTASTGKRLLAFSIDRIFTCLCFLPVWIQVFSSALKTQTVSVEWTWLLSGVLLFLFYQWLFLYFLGGTVGKLLMGLRVVPAAQPDQSLGLMQSLLRVLTDCLSLFFGHALRAPALLRLDRTHVADWVAETRVVQKKPRRNLVHRRWLLALFVVIVSGCTQFQKIYWVLMGAHISGSAVFFEDIKQLSSE